MLHVVSCEQISNSAGLSVLTAPSLVRNGPEMFTGIIECQGHITTNSIDRDGQLEMEVGSLLGGLQVGDSVAVNGCCLTVTSLSETTVVVDVMVETARRTTLASLRAGDLVNLEGALRLGDRLGGHLVSGHIDGVGTVTSVRDEGIARTVSFTAPPTVMPFVVEKGSIAIDGISLTVVAVTNQGFTVSLIPHTLSVTTAGRWYVGAAVNLEADQVAKFVQSGVERYLQSARVTQ